MFFPPALGLADNAVAMVVAGAMLVFARDFVQQALELVLGYLVVSVEINDQDSAEVYRWVEFWISSQPFSNTFSSLRAGLEEPNTPVWSRKMLSSQKVHFVPGRGLHVFFAGAQSWRLVWASFVRRRGTGTGDISTGAERAIVLYTPRLNGGRTALMAMVAAAQTMSRARECNEVGVFMPSSEYRAGWTRALAVPALPSGSAVLPRGLYDSVVADARRFLQGKDWYRSMGIPHRRGYLLYGPPGTGKSTFIHALAGELGLDVAFVSMAGISSDQQLLSLLARAPSASLLALEDIDAMFPAADDRRLSQQQHRKPGGGVGHVTLSGLLNALDGVAAQHGRIVVMTSNYPERLDAALVRPGRIDVKVELGHADDHQIATMFARFFPASAKAAHDFVAAVRASGARTVAMADIQKFLLAQAAHGHGNGSDDDEDNAARAIAAWPEYHQRTVRYEHQMEHCREDRSAIPTQPQLALQDTVTTPPQSPVLQNNVSAQPTSPPVLSSGDTADASAVVSRAETTPATLRARTSCRVAAAATANVAPFPSAWVSATAA